MKCFIIVIVLFVSYKAFALDVIKGDCTGNWDAVRECEKKYEPVLLSKIPNIAVRTDSELKLFPIKGSNPPKILSEEKINYTLIAHYSEQNLSIIRLSGYEYYDMYAYHHTYGSYVQVHDQVAISPTGEFMAGYNADLESDYGLNAISIYRLGDWPTLITSYRPTSFAIEKAEFKNNGLIELNTFFYTSEFKKEKGSCQLVYDSSVWVFKSMNCAATTLSIKFEVQQND